MIEISHEEAQFFFDLLDSHLSRVYGNEGIYEMWEKLDVYLHPGDEPQPVADDSD